MAVYVTCVAHSERVVKQLLLEHTTIAMAVKQLHIDTAGDIMLIQIATPNHKAYVFDIKKTPALVQEGLLWRLIVSPEITKVMHDCRSASAALKRQFKLTLKGVFDTQAAYCVEMIHNGLPPRLISLDQLYYKYGQPEEAHLNMLQESLSGIGLYWAQRPVSKQMLLEASSDVLVFLPHLYDNLKSVLCETGMEDTRELTFAYIHGYFKPPKDYKASKWHRTDSTSPLRKLSFGQKQLLHGTTAGVKV